MAPDSTGGEYRLHRPAPVFTEEATTLVLCAAALTP